MGLSTKPPPTNCIGGALSLLIIILKNLKVSAHSEWNVLERITLLYILTFSSKEREGTYAERVGTYRIWRCLRV